MNSAKHKFLIATAVFGFSSLVYAFFSLNYETWLRANTPGFLVYVFSILGFITPILFLVYWGKYGKELSIAEWYLAGLIGIFIVLPNFFILLLFLVFSSGGLQSLG